MASPGDKGNATSVLCFTCGEFVLAEEYDSHVSSVHFCPIECLICNEKVDIDDFEEHLSCFHIDRTEVFRCTVCEGYFKGEKGYDDHIEECGQRLCDVCGKFLKLEEYERHMLSGVHDIKIEKNDKSESEKNSKMSNHSNCEKLHMCHCCRSLFKVKSDLIEHMAEAHKDRIWYTCSPCRVAFRSREEYHDHLKNSHSVTVPSDKLPDSTDSDGTTEQKPVHEKNVYMPKVRPEVAASDVMKKESDVEQLEDLTNHMKAVHYVDEKAQHLDQANSTEMNMAEKAVQPKLEHQPKYSGDNDMQQIPKSLSDQTRCGLISGAANTQTITVADLLKLTVKTHEVRTKEAIKKQGVLKILWHVGVQTGNDILSRRTHVLASCKIDTDEGVTTADKGTSVSESTLRESLESAVTYKLQWNQEVQTGYRDISDSSCSTRTCIRKVERKRNRRKCDKGIVVSDSDIQETLRSSVKQDASLNLNWDKGVQTGVDEVSCSLRSGSAKSKTQNNTVVPNLNKNLLISEKDIQETMQIIEKVFQKIGDWRLAVNRRSGTDQEKSLSLAKPEFTCVKAVFICSLCSDVFLSRKKLFQHLKNHPCYICECQSVFVNMETYESHLPGRYCQRSKGLKNTMMLLSQPPMEVQSRAKESLLLDRFSSTNQLNVWGTSEPKSTSRVTMSVFCGYRCACGLSFQVKSRYHQHLITVMGLGQDLDEHGYMEAGSEELQDVSSQRNKHQDICRKSSEQNQEGGEGQEPDDQCTREHESQGSVRQRDHAPLQRDEHSPQYKSEMCEGTEGSGFPGNNQDSLSDKQKSKAAQGDKISDSQADKNPDSRFPPTQNYLSFLADLPDSQKKRQVWYGCSFCPLAFATLPTYKVHSTERHHTDCESQPNGPEYMKWLCTECSIQYFTEEGYKSHKKRSSRCTPPDQDTKYKSATNNNPVIEDVCEDEEDSDEPKPNNHVCRSWFHCNLCPKAFSTFSLFCNHKSQEHESQDFSFKLNGLWKHGRCIYCSEPMASSPQDEEKTGQKEQTCDGSEKVVVFLEEQAQKIQGLMKPQNPNAPSTSAIWPGIQLEDSTTSIMEKSVSVPEPYLKLRPSPLQDTLRTGAPSEQSHRLRLKNQSFDNLNRPSLKEKSVSLPDPYVKLVKIEDTSPLLRTFICSPEDCLGGEPPPKQSPGEQTNVKGLKRRCFDNLNSPSSEASDMKEPFADGINIDASGLPEQSDFKVIVKTEPVDCLDGEVGSSVHVTQSADKVISDEADTKQNISLGNEGSVTTSTLGQIGVNTDVSGVTEEKEQVVVKTELEDCLDSEFGLTVHFVQGADEVNGDEADSKQNISLGYDSSVTSSTGTGFLGSDTTEWTMVTPIVTVKKEVDQLSLEPSAAFDGESLKLDQGGGNLLKMKAKDKLSLKTLLTGQGAHSLQQDNGKGKSPIRKKVKSGDSINDSDNGMKVKLKSRSKSRQGIDISSEQPSTDAKKRTKKRRSRKSESKTNSTQVKLSEEPQTQATNNTQSEESEYTVGTGALEIDIKTEPLSEPEDDIPYMSERTEDLPDNGKLIIDESGSKDIPIKQEAVDQEDLVPDQALTNMVYIHKPSEKIFAEPGETPEKKGKHGKHLKNANLCKCGICGDLFGTMQKLVRHSKTHVTATKQYKCPLCNKTFTELRKAIEHKDSHGPKEFVCPICKQEFHKSWHLKEHLEIHKNFPSSPGNVCQVCGSEFKEFSSLRKHMHSHLKDKARGMPGDNLLDGQDSIPNPKKYPCDECDEVFNSKNRRTVHVRYNHRGEPKNHCELCDKSFYSPSELQRHFRTHTGERPFACGVCGKAFALATTLKDHLMSHTGERPFKCSVCGKCYSSSSILGRHKVTHLGVRKHKCTICGKDFQYANSLTIHLRTHTNERPYSCDVCKKTFTMSCHYRVHMRIHTGEKPYKCKFCDFRFNNYGSHYRHVRTHSEWKPDNAGDGEVQGNLLEIQEVASVDSSEADDIEGKILPYMLSSALSSPFLLQQAVKDKSVSDGKDESKTQTCVVFGRNDCEGESDEGDASPNNSRDHMSDDKPTDRDVTNSQDSMKEVSDKSGLPIKLEENSSEDSPQNVKELSIRLPNLQGKGKSVTGQTANVTRPVGGNTLPKSLTVPVAKLKTASSEANQSVLAVSASVKEKLKRSLTKPRDTESNVSGKKCRLELDKEKQETVSSCMSQDTECAESSGKGLKQNSAKRGDPYSKAASSLIMQILMTKPDN